MGASFASIGWDDVHLFDDSPYSCTSACQLLPSANVHEIEQDIKKQEASLICGLNDLLSYLRPGLICFDWAGTLEALQMTLPDGEATAGLLRALCDKEWLFACVSNDPNDTIKRYQKCLTEACAPTFTIFAYRDRIHQLLRWRARTILVWNECTARLLQSDLGSSRSSGGDGGEGDDLASIAFPASASPAVHCLLIR